MTAFPGTTLGAVMNSAIGRKGSTGQSHASGGDLTKVQGLFSAGTVTPANPQSKLTRLVRYLAINLFGIKMKNGREVSVSNMLGMALTATIENRSVVSDVASRDAKLTQLHQIYTAGKIYFESARGVRDLDRLRMIYLITSGGYDVEQEHSEVVRGIKAEDCSSIVATLVDKCGELVVEHVLNILNQINDEIGTLVKEGVNTRRARMIEIAGRLGDEFTTGIEVRERIREFPALVTYAVIAALPPKTAAKILTELGARESARILIELGVEKYAKIFRYFSPDYVERVIPEIDVLHPSSDMMRFVKLEFEAMVTRVAEMEVAAVVRKIEKSSTSNAVCIAVWGKLSNEMVTQVLSKLSDETIKNKLDRESVLSVANRLDQELMSKITNKELNNTGKKESAALVKRLRTIFPSVVDTISEID